MQQYAKSQANTV